MLLRAYLAKRYHISYIYQIINYIHVPNPNTNQHENLDNLNKESKLLCDANLPLTRLTVHSGRIDYLFDSVLRIFPPCWSSNDVVI